MKTVALPLATPAYSADGENRTRRLIEGALDKTFTRDREVQPVRLILVSPNGTRYLVTVSNAGVLSTVAAPVVLDRSAGDGGG